MSSDWLAVYVLRCKLSADCTAEHYGDIALLLSHCRDVCSVEVPSAMQVSTFLMFLITWGGVGWGVGEERTVIHANDAAFCYCK